MSVRVMISFPEDFLREVDQQAEIEHRSRSELLREAVRYYLRDRERRQAPGELAMVQQAVAVQDKLAAMAMKNDENSTDVIRYWREQR